VETVARILAPYLGETMAHASTRAQCDRLGIDREELSPDQTRMLIQRVGNGMNVFVGRDKAAAITEEIRRALSHEAQP
jgi:hypothetical protein